MAYFSICTYVKTQFSSRLWLSSKDLAFNLCRKVRSTFGFLYQRNWFCVPGLLFCLEQWCRMLVQRGPESELLALDFCCLKPLCRQACMRPALFQMILWLYSKIYSCVFVTSATNLSSNLHLMPHTHTEAGVVGFEEHQHLLAHQVAQGGVWCLTALLYAQREFLIYCCSKFSLALNLADFMTIFQICSQ